MGAALQAALAEAATQDGVASRAQLRRHLSARQIGHATRSGKLEQVLPSVFAALGAPDTWRRRLRAIELWAGRGAALSHETAGALHGFNRVREGALAVTLCRSLELAAPYVVHRVARLPHGDVTTINGLRVTSPCRTLVDLACTLPQADLRACVDQALRQRRVTLEQLSNAVARSKHRRGVGVLRELIEGFDRGDGPTESELEALVLDLIAEAELPRPTKQRAVVAGGRLRRLDFHFPGTRVVIEADGYAYHAGLNAFEADRERLNALTLRGFRVLHWTWAALHERPHELLAQLQLALAQ